MDSLARIKMNRLWPNAHTVMNINYALKEALAAHVEIGSLLLDALAKILMPPSVFTKEAGIASPEIGGSGHAYAPNVVCWQRHFRMDAGSVRLDT
jgi:hypothetical protein